MLIRKAPLTTNEQTVADATGSGPGGDFLGSDFRNAYLPGVALTGAGQVVGLFEFGAYFSNDIALYQQKAGLQNIRITNVSVGGFNLTPAPGFDDGEEALDIDMVMCVAPGATIMVYEGNNGDDIFNRMATDNLAKQVSCSFGWSPPDASLNNILLEMSAQGQSVFVASGDGGAYSSSSTIFAPDDNTNVTCVGGTSLTTSGAGGPWQSETTWPGSGGGVSSRYPIPGYQQGLSMTANHGSATQRNIPDVAALSAAPAPPRRYGRVFWPWPISKPRPMEIRRWAALTHCSTRRAKVPITTLPFTTSRRETILTHAVPPITPR
jgi:subtilase family serine protease